MISDIGRSKRCARAELLRAAPTRSGARCRARSSGRRAPPPAAAGPRASGGSGRAARARTGSATGCRSRTRRATTPSVARTKSVERLSNEKSRPQRVAVAQADHRREQRRVDRDEDDAGGEPASAKRTSSVAISPSAPQDEVRPPPTPPASRACSSQMLTIWMYQVPRLRSHSGTCWTSGISATSSGGSSSAAAIRKTPVVWYAWLPGVRTTKSCATATPVARIDERRASRRVWRSSVDEERRRRGDCAGRDDQEVGQRLGRELAARARRCSRARSRPRGGLRSLRSACALHAACLLRCRRESKAAQPTDSAGSEGMPGLAVRHPPIEARPGQVPRKGEGAGREPAHPRSVRYGSVELRARRPQCRRRVAAAAARRCSCRAPRSRHRRRRRRCAHLSGRRIGAQPLVRRQQVDVLGAASASAGVSS